MWLTWLRYLSWFNYGFEALVINQWDNYGNISMLFVVVVVVETQDLLRISKTKT